MKKKFSAKKPTQAELFSMAETTIITKKMVATHKFRRPKRPRIDQDLHDENARLDEQRFQRKIRDLDEALKALKEELEKLKKKK